jgi:hypothetical protein
MDFVNFNNTIFFLETIIFNFMIKNIQSQNQEFYTRFILKPLYLFIFIIFTLSLHFDYITYIIYNFF